MSDLFQPEFVRAMHAFDAEAGISRVFPYVTMSRLRSGGTARRAIRVVPRGYDREQVDALVRRAEQALATGGEVQRAKARQALRAADLGRRLRGYAPGTVRRLFDQLSRELGVGRPGPRPPVGGGAVSPGGSPGSGAQPEQLPEWRPLHNYDR